MTTDMQKAPSVAREALTSADDATPVARYDLSTSEGGRRYIADFFATELRRHDFAGYINTHLAADFACALAQHLAAPQSRITLLPDDHRIVEKIADEIERGKLDHPGFYRNTQLAEVLRRMLDAAVAAPPAQGIDLGQEQDAARWRWVREQNGVTVSVEEADDDGDMTFVSGHTPEELDAAIDGQRDAAPGVAS